MLIWHEVVTYFPIDPLSLLDGWTTEALPLPWEDLGNPKIQMGEGKRAQRIKHSSESLSWIWFLDLPQRQMVKTYFQIQTLSYNFRASTACEWEALILYSHSTEVKVENHWHSPTRTAASDSELWPVSAQCQEAFHAAAHKVSAGSSLPLQRQPF